MENERELLELAAKAAGVGPIRGFDYGHGARAMAVLVDDGRKQPYRWNPKLDDGDCARLEAALWIDVDWAEDGVIARNRDKRAGVLFEDHNNDRNATRRMASLRVAAEIGRAMQSDKR